MRKPRPPNLCRLGSEWVVRSQTGEYEWRAPEVEAGMYFQSLNLRESPQNGRSIWPRLGQVQAATQQVWVAHPGIRQHFNNSVQNFEQQTLAQWNGHHAAQIHFDRQIHKYREIYPAYFSVGILDPADWVVTRSRPRCSRATPSSRTIFCRNIEVRTPPRANLGATTLKASCRGRFAEVRR